MVHLTGTNLGQFSLHVLPIRPNVGADRRTILGTISFTTLSHPDRTPASPTTHLTSRTCPCLPRLGPESPQVFRSLSVTLRFSSLGRVCLFLPRGVTVCSRSSSICVFGWRGTSRSVGDFYPVHIFGFLDS